MRYFWIVALALLPSLAAAQDCPVGAKSCKVVVMVPEEVQTLAQPGGIFDAAAFANRMQLGPITDAWRRKIETSPDGKVQQPASTSATTAPLPKPDPRK